MRKFCTKKIYFSENSANNSIERILSKAKKNKCMKKHKPKRSYQCPNCKFWHITSQDAR